MPGRGWDCDDVIAMTGRTQGPLREIETYWQALRGETGGVPPRSAVDPRGMNGALEHAFLIQRIAPGIGRLRVAGSHLNALTGMEVAGLPLSALFTPMARDRLAEGLVAVFDKPAILRATLRSPAGWQRGPLSAQMLILPLTDEHGQIGRALGGLVSEGRIDRTPRRFDITHLELGALEGRPPVKRSPKPRHFAEDQAPFTAKRTASRPHLRVVVSND